MPPSEKQKQVLIASGTVATGAAFVGSASHVGHYAALGFLDVSLSQAARAGKEFIPDGVEAVLGTLSRVTAATFAHPFFALAVVLSGAAILVALRKKPSPVVASSVFLLLFLMLTILGAPAFQVTDALREPPDIARIPQTRFARLVLKPVIEGMIYSRIRPPGGSWDASSIRSSLSVRYAILAAGTLLLLLLQQLTLPSHAVVQRTAKILVFVALIGTSYYYGAVEEDTSYKRTLVSTHAHPAHTAFLIATVGKTCSVYSFEYGNEDIDERLTDTDEERKEDILLARLLRP